MKLIKLLLPLSLLFFFSCEDDHEHIHTETEEEMTQEFIEHAEDDHFNNAAVQQAVSVVGSPAINNEGDVYSIAFNGATSGMVKYSFTEEHADEPHDRTIFTDQAVTILVNQATRPMVTPEKVVDLSSYQSTIVKKMEVYELMADTEYTITLSGVTTDTVKILVAPRGIDGEHEHE